ncbi:hypothetical protein [Paenibacillus sp. KN14-4R]|uniref:hypothetical protein n=1 Tax=Paenibacillus sp. KN14-4R TaxID=3445773 RepID=UPI003F9F8C0D
MIKRFLVILVTLIIVGMMFLGYFIWYKPLFTAKEIKIIEITRLQTTKKVASGGWWTFQNDSVYENYNRNNGYGITLPKVDFSKKNLICSAGREIEKLTYSVGSSRELGYKDVYLGKVIYKTEYNPHIIYVYEIDKFPIVSDNA